MKSLFLQILRLLAILTVSSLVVAVPIKSLSAQADDLTADLASIGAPGPKAINFKVWTDKPKGADFKPGDRAIIHMTVEREGYMTILSFSSDGSVTLVSPSEALPETEVQPGMLYTLFGDDYPVRMTFGDKSGDAKVIVYLSPTPFVLAPLEIPTGKKLLVIPPTAHEEMRILRDKLISLAKNESFNRTILRFPNETGQGLDVRIKPLIGKMAPKRIPGGLESTPPETLTGTAGAKPAAPVGDSKE
jgi:hypothetical protein